MSDIVIDILWLVMMLILGISYWLLWLFVGVGLMYFGMMCLCGIGCIVCIVVVVLFIVYIGLGLYVIFVR